MVRPCIPLAAGLVLAPLAARAELTVCNQTDASASIAIGYNEDGTWVSEGWWTVAAGDCTVVVGGDLMKPFYYWRATSPRYDWEDSRYMFCTSPKVFTIRGDTDCAARGYEKNPFNEIALEGVTSFKLDLTAAGGEAPMPGRDAPIGGAAADPPGTHGEPYSISGILSHCEVFDASMACEVHDDGWRYVANSAGPTPLALLESLLARPVNTPIAISGDMIGYEGFTAEVTIRETSTGAPDPFARVRADLQGLWADTDGGTQVLIHGGLWEELLLGMPVFSFPMHLAEGCDAAPGAGLTISFRSAETGAFDSCLVVLGLDRDRLRIGYAGTGIETTYRRVD